MASVMTRRNSRKKEFTNMARFHWRRAGSPGNLYITMRLDGEGADGQKAQGWYFNAAACTEAAHWFAKMAKDLKARKLAGKKKLKKKFSNFVTGAPSFSSADYY